MCLNVTWLQKIGAILSSVSILACGESTAPNPPAEPHRAASVRVIKGDGQTTTVGSMLPQPIVLEVLDSVGAPAWGRSMGYIDGKEFLVRRDGTVAIPIRLGEVAGPVTLTFEPSGQDVDPALQVTAHETALARGFDHFASRFAGLPYYVTNDIPMIRGQIFSPRDTFDNVVPWPTTTVLTVPSGWTVVGDTISAPAADFVGAGDVTISADGKSLTQTIVRLDNLRARRWNVEFRCEAPGAPADLGSQGGALTDSVSFTGTVALIAYGGDRDFFEWEKGGPQPPIQVYLQGTYVAYMHAAPARVWNLDGKTEIATYDSWGLMSQRPDSITFPYPANADGASGAVAVTAHGGTSRYVGGSWCDPALFSVRPPVVLAAY